MTEVDDLVATVEALRADRFPDLPSSVVEAILRVEATHVEDRGPVLRLVERAIDDHLSDES
jgi:hypothetical protein